ncbi:MAG: SpoIIE family protein phosphatase, partial [Thermoleophilia bacterium]|nr:SpoIIE family protein phosphatase [Thermoleophilia bacterium]
DGSVAEWVASATDVEDELRLREEHERQHRELRVAQTQIAQATAAGRVGVWSLEIGDGGVTVDPVLAEMFGVGDRDGGPVTVPVARMTAAVDPGDRDRVTEALETAIAAGGDYEAEFRVQGGDGHVRWMAARGLCEAGDDGRAVRLSGVGIDVTEERRALERLEFLARAGQLLAGSRDLQQTLIMVADLTTPLLGDFAVFDLIEDGNVVKVAGRHSSPARRDFAVQARSFTPPLDHPRHPAAVAMRTGEVVLTDTVTGAWIDGIAVNAAHAEFLRSLEISSFLCVPLLAGERIIGALSLVFSESGRRHSASEVGLAQELAARSAIAIDNAHLFSRVEEARRRAEAQTREQARLLASEREALSRARLLERNAAHLAAALTVEDVCRTTADDLEAFGLDVVVVQVLRDAGTLEAVATAGVAMGDMDERMRLFPLSRDDMVPVAIRRGSAVEFQRGGDRDTWFPASAEARRLHAIETSIAIPLMDSAGQVVGAVYAGSREEGWLTDARRAVLHGTAQQCGLALERARLHQVEHRSRMRSELIATVLGEMEGRIGLAARAEAMLDALVPRLADAGAVTASGPERSVVAVTRLEPDELGALDSPDGHGWVTVALADAGLELLLGLREGRDDTLLRGDPDLLHDLAQRAALALQTARLHDEEHQIAVELQRSLLPSQLTVVDGVGVQARYQTAERRLEVGGDWYDTIPLPDGRIGLCVGDVVGHGLEAGIVMGQLRNALLTQAPGCEGPADLVERLEQVAARIDGAQLTTVCYAELDPRDGDLVYACAGHPPPLVLRASGKAELLWDGRSAPLCSPAVRTRREGRTRLEPGARLLMYSDGLVERRMQDIDGRFAQLAAAAASAAAASLGEFCDTTISLMTAGERRDDDLALLCTEYRPQVGERFRARFPAEVLALSAMRRALDEWAAHLGIANRGDLILACGEACSNAVEHAYRGGASGEVMMDAGFDGRAVELRIRDHGAWRTPTERRDRGRGLAILRAVAEEVVLVPGEAGSTVTLRVPVRVPPAGADAPAAAPAAERA